MKIDRKDYAPLYIQFYHLMKEEILKMEAGSSLPPERILCEQYKLDRVTVRKALTMLSDEKLIERRQGRGTCVLPQHTAEKSKEGIILFGLFHGSRLIDRLGEPFYANSMEELENCFRSKHEYVIYSKLQKENDLLSLCTQLNTKGIILAGSADESIFEQAKSLNMPVVTYNNAVPDFPAVLPDNQTAMNLVANHLLRLGHRRIGFIHVPGYSNSQIRLDCFRHILEEAGLQEPFVAEGDWSETGGYEAASRILNDFPAVTAIFAGNDSMAIGALRAACEKGIEVPKQLSIVGFDGIAQSELTTPPLTTVKMDVQAMAEATALLMSHMLAGENVSPNIHAVITGKLLERGSSCSVSEKTE